MSKRKIPVGATQSRNSTPEGNCAESHSEHRKDLIDVDDVKPSKEDKRRRGLRVPKQQFHHLFAEHQHWFDRINQLDKQNTAMFVHASESMFFFKIN